MYAKVTHGPVMQLLHNAKRIDYAILKHNTVDKLCRTARNTGYPAIVFENKYNYSITLDITMALIVL